MIPVDQTDRVVRGAACTLELAPVDAGGSPVEPDDGGTVTVAAGGREVVTAPAVLSGGRLVCALPALGLLDTYAVSWRAPVGGEEWEWLTALEVAGAHYFGLDAFRRERPDLAAFDDARVAAARRLAEDRIEAACGCAFVPRGAREAVVARGREALPLRWPEPRALYAVAVDGAPLAAEEVAALRLHPGGMVLREGGWPDGALVTLHYEHGLSPTPAPVRHAAMLLAREYLVPSDLPARATLLATEVGSFRLSVAGRDGATGLPEVDAVIAEYSRRRPEVG